MLDQEYVVKCHIFADAKRIENYINNAMSWFHIDTAKATKSQVCVLSSNSIDDTGDGGQTQTC